MLIDGVELAAGSTLQNPTIESGANWPATGTQGALFFNTTLSQLGMYSSGAWSAINQAHLTAAVNSAISALVGSAPAALDTIAELAAGIQNIAQTNDLSASVVGKPSASQVVLRFVVARAFSMPANLVGSMVKSAVAATASTVFSIQKNGAQFSTATFTAAATSATLGTCATQNFALGDVITVVAPATADATLADIGFTLLGTLS